ncbi:UTP--glucose-1-phosphate uridylyltransferase GalU [Patescibacteria group bacterium]|nr:UTP--glucose-1-phosphate uridylyltransferase GalU [Patescibacteria group bacterium]
MKIRKAIIPVAGMGTRFLPATKAQPKEMLSLVDKPVIQYIVEEAVAAGIEQVIFITSQTKRALEDHFDTNFELETRLKEKGKTKELDEVRAVSNLANFIYIRQKEPRGDGHAILQAKDLIGDEPCAVLFGDDIVDHEKPCIAQLMEVYEKYRDPVIAVQHIPKKDISSYGVIDGKQMNDRTYEVVGFVEKPKPEEAPSDLAVIGKYIITPEVMAALENAPAGKDGEIRLADAFQSLLGKRSIYAYNFEGTRYDCGNKLQFLIASVDYGLKHAEVNKDGKFSDFIKKRAAELK